MVYLDDEHRAEVGDPGLPVVSVERGKKVLVSLNKTFQVCDHDFTCFSLKTDIPDKSAALGMKVWFI